MHGRVKTITSKEKQERQKKENLEKLAKFQKGVDFLKKFKSLSSIKLIPPEKPVEGNENNPEVETTDLPQEQHENQKDHPNLDTSHKSEKAKLFEKQMAEFSQQNMIQEKLLNVTGQMLLHQPDLSLAWNIRRNLVHRLKIDEELNLSLSGIMANPKSYNCWFHRRFIFKYGDFSQNPGNSPTSTLSDYLDNELQNTNHFLHKDGRNFHCWDHRRWLSKQMNLSLDSEIKFADSLIAINFSNHSAWHYKSTLLSKKYGENLNFEIIQSEINYVTNAFYVDPHDSASWIYYDWLIHCFVNLQKQYVGTDVQIPNILIEQVKSLSELDSIEPNSKYVILHLINVSNLYQDKDCSIVTKITENLSKYVEILKSVDPLRKNYYNTLVQ